MTDRRTILGAALAVVTVAALVLRIPSIAEPLGIDQGLFASAARAMSRGLVLYRDVWDHKPPAIYLTYLAAFRLFGWSAASIGWIDVLAATATAALIFAVVRRHRDALAGAVGAACFTAFSMPGWLHRNGGFLERSVAETFILVAVGAAAWCATGLQKRATIAGAAGLGFWAGVAIAFKPNAGVYLITLLAWVACYQAGTRRDQVRTVVVACAAAAIGPALTVLFLWRTGALADAWVALVLFNRAYVSDGFTLGGYAVRFLQAVQLRLETEPLWIAGGLGTAVAAWELVRTRRLDPLAGLAIAWGAGAALTILTNGSGLFNTYFVQALAPLAVLGTWLLFGLARRDVLPRAAAIVAVLGIVLVLWQRHYVARVFEYVDLDRAALAGTIDRAAYLEHFGGYANDRGYSARAQDEVARYIVAHTTRDDVIYQFGINDAGLCFSTDRMPAQRFLRSDLFVRGAFRQPGFQTADVVRTLEARRPAYILFERLHAASAMGQIVDRLEQDPDVLRLLAAYSLETRIEDFTIYRRK
jgi:4-amino-4-deoxy-L-arabinose transferase-like glycosyltransferase